VQRFSLSDQVDNNLHVTSVEEHGPDVVGPEGAALVHPPALAPGAGLAEVRQLHHLFADGFGGGIGGIVRGSAPFHQKNRA